MTRTQDLFPALNKASIAALVAAGRKDAQLQQHGLRVRVRENGALDFDVLYRVAGKRKSVALRTDGLTLDGVKALANKTLTDINLKDADPNAAKREVKARSANTVEAIYGKWFAEVVQGKWGSEADVRSNFARHVLPVFGATVVYDLDRAQITNHLRALAAKHGSTCRKVRNQLAQCLDWHRAVDPLFNTIVMPRAADIPGCGDEDRTRVLEADEIADVWAASVELGGDFGSLVRVLLLTGCRRDEIANMEPGEIKAGTMLQPAHIAIPAARMKGKNGQRREHLVPLTDAIRAQLPATGTFRAMQGGAFTGFSTYKDKLDAIINARRAARGLAPIQGWVLHDLRRTCRSWLSRIGVDRQVAEAILAHVIPGVEGVYDRYDRFAERKAALEAWADRVATFVRGENNVVALKA